MWEIMAVIEMQKLSVIGLNTRRTAFIHELMHLGAVEINSQEGQIDDAQWLPDIFRTSNSAVVSRIEADIARVQTAIEAISAYDGAKKPLIHTRQEITREDFVQYLDSCKTTLEKTVDTAVFAHKRIADGQNELNRLQTVIVGLKPWEKLDLPLEKTETQYMDISFGTVSAQVNVQTLLTDLLEQAPSAVLGEVSADTHQRYLYVMCLKEEKETVAEALRSVNFMPIAFTEGEGSASARIKACETAIENTKQEIKEQEAVLASLADKKKDLEYLADSLSMRKDRAQIVGDMLSTEKVFYFDGWVPTPAVKEVEKLLQEYEMYYEFTQPEPDEEVPVLLKNNSFATPFEAVTSMYSLPSRQDIDPTAILAPFYFIFFGLMLSDAAYGIILAVLCGVILKKYKLEGMMYRMFKMFFFCGISTFIWGALFGGWFGDFFQVAARTLFNKEITIDPLWFNPMEDPMKLLIFSLILGAIHLFVGMGIQAYMLIRDGHPLDALFDIGLWYLLLIGLVLFGVGGMVAPVLTTIGQWMSIVGAVGILLTGGRSKKGFLGKLTGGLGSLYGITSYLSDVLSYSRLLALGLATGVVAQVINTLGSLAGGGVVGAIVLLLAFAFGTVFNIAINALGAFVHSCRLQYVEFFGKFYTGGGRAFRPFERKTKYVKILKEGNEHGSR